MILPDSVKGEKSVIFPDSVKSVILPVKYVPLFPDSAKCVIFPGECLSKFPDFVKSVKSPVKK